MNKKYLFLALITIVFPVTRMSAQESQSIFNFLSLPTSAHSAALGGRNISLAEDDAALMFQNPALMSNVSDRTLNVNFLTFMKGSNTGSASFVKATGERGTWGVGAQFVGYGKVDMYDNQGGYLGQSATLLDMNLTGGYSYLLGRGWAGGVTGKFLYSGYCGYTSVGLCVDLGVNYYNEDKDFSFSAVVANLGGQVKAFGDVHEKLPFDLQLGISKRLGRLPLRIHLTLYDLVHWRSAYYYPADLSGFQVFLNHVNLGIDALLWNGKVWAGLGYNFRRGNELIAAGSSNAAGLTLGAGVNIKDIKFGLAYAKYHVGAPSISVTLNVPIKVHSRKKAIVTTDNTENKENEKDNNSN